MEDLCNQCGMCCQYIPVDIENRLLLRDSIQPLSEEFESMLIPIEDNSLLKLNENYKENVLKTNVKYYKCKYLLNGNICFHNNKPKECEEFPKSAFAFIPDSCGYYGIQFIKKEEVMQKIRKMKEEILDYESLIKTNPADSRGYKIIVEKLKKHIEKYSIYNSSNW